MMVVWSRRGRGVKSLKMEENLVSSYGERDVKGAWQRCRCP